MYNNFTFIYNINNYFILVFFILIALFLGFILFVLSFFLGSRKPDKEKISAYECGFSPFEDARQKFDVRFYLVAILFIVFDLELTFLFPWSITLNSTGFFGFFSMFIFLFILIIGFVYEWVNGALDWD